jgi:hypothetical protein
MKMKDCLCECFIAVESHLGREVWLGELDSSIRVVASSDAMLALLEPHLISLPSITCELATTLRNEPHRNPSCNELESVERLGLHLGICPRLAPSLCTQLNPDIETIDVLLPGLVLGAVSCTQATTLTWPFVQRRNIILHYQNIRAPTLPEPHTIFHCCTRRCSKGYLHTASISYRNSIKCATHQFAVSGIPHEDSLLYKLQTYHTASIGYRNSIKCATHQFAVSSIPHENSLLYKLQEYHVLSYELSASSTCCH